MSNRNGSYPLSVQPGIPNLSETPKGWKREPLRKYLKEIKRPVVMKDDEQYRLVTVKRSRGGVVEREKLLGKKIKVKSQFLVKTGDFLISKRQIVHGACGIVPENLDGSIISNEYAVLGTNGGIDLEFLKFLSESAHFQQTCFHSSIGVHVEKMIFKLDWWFKWDFNIPPIPEQNKMVRIFSTWEKAIKKVEDLIKNTQQQKKALTQIFFGKMKNFPGCIEQKTKKYKLREISKTYSGGTPSRSQSDYYEGSIPWIKSGEVNLRKIFQTEEMITKLGLKNSSAKLVEPETIIVAMYGATAGKIAISKIKAAINQAILAILPMENIDKKYFFYYMEDQLENVKRLVQGAQPNLNADIIKSMEIELPNFEKQVEIGNIIETIQSEKDKLILLKKSFIQEKKALMQQLLAGKRRVKIDQ